MVFFSLLRCPFVAATNTVVPRLLDLVQSNLTNVAPETWRKFSRKKRQTVGFKKVGLGPLKGVCIHICIYIYIEVKLEG